MARAYLSASNPASLQRTWQDVMDQASAGGREACQSRFARALKSKAIDSLRAVKVIETTPEDFLAVLNLGSFSVVHFLRCGHNLALERFKKYCGRAARGFLPLGEVWARAHVRSDLCPSRNAAQRQKDRAPH